MIVKHPHSFHGGCVVSTDEIQEHSGVIIPDNHLLLLLIPL